MPIHCQVQRDFTNSPEAVFALAVDSERFAPTFTGFWPIAPIRAIKADGPLGPGACRSVHNEDCSVLQECTRVLEPPHRHGYALSGFRAPFSWLVGSAEAEWRISPQAGGARVLWAYSFHLRATWAWPLAKPLVALCMKGAMRRCLANMAALLRTEAQP